MGSNSCRRKCFPKEVNIAEKCNAGTQTETRISTDNSEKMINCILFFIILFFFAACVGFFLCWEGLYPFNSRSSLQVCPVQDPLQDFDFSDEVFQSPQTFKTDYTVMERNLKIFVYPYGDKDIVCDRQKRLHGKYGSEGHFFQNLNQSQFLTTDPEKAHLFLIPISCHKLRAEGRSYNDATFTLSVHDFINSLISKYPYWNRTLGADHFIVICHDIGIAGTERISHLLKNSIRIVCSPNYNFQYVPHKDISLPQIRQPFALPPAGDDVKNRTILAFWAGRRNSHVRDMLIRAWQNDTELDIQNYRMNVTSIIGRVVYQEKFFRSKFCICPGGGGTHVHGGRIADSIHYGCVPVILSDYYILPFNDILDWRKFSVLLKENDVYRLKKILQDISDKEYRVLQDNTIKVQKHFMWNLHPVRLDAFHLVMYDLWLRRHVIKY